MLKTHRTAALAALIALAAGPALADTSAAAAAFERLKTLEGSWQLQGQPEHGLRIGFNTSARGSVLIEEWTYQGAPHSLTLYHRDGDTLLATHYCPQGNQPRMALTSGADDTIHFTFRDVTDYDPAREQHQHDLSFSWSGDGPLERSEIYRDGEGGDHPSGLTLERAAD